MKIEIEICGKAGKGITRAKIEEAVRRAVTESGRFGKNRSDLSVSLAFVEPREIKKINRTYRSKDEVTDVLSFSYLANSESMQNKKQLLGELVICPSYILDSAKKNGVNYSRQLVYAITHGVLHLAGFRHSKKMFVLQDRISAT